MAVKLSFIELFPVFIVNYTVIMMFSGTYNSEIELSNKDFMRTLFLSYKASGLRPKR